VSDIYLLLEEQVPQLTRHAAALLRDATMADELVEDTMREALANPQHYADKTRLRLLTTLHELRDNPFRQLTLGTPEPCTPRASLGLSELDRALDELTEDDRAVVLLVGLEGMTPAEAAAVLRVPECSLRARLSRARAELRRLMGIADAHPRQHPARRERRNTRALAHDTRGVRHAA